MYYMWKYMYLFRRMYIQDLHIYIYKKYKY